MFSRISRFFGLSRPSARTSSRTRPLQAGRLQPGPVADSFSMPLPAPPLSIRSLGTGAAETNIRRQVQGLPVAHSHAVENALMSGFSAVLRQPEMMREAGWRGVHVVKATYAPGTLRSPLIHALPVGAYGVQLGATQCVRGRNGHLHVYGAVYMPGVAA